MPSTDFNTWARHLQFMTSSGNITGDMLRERSLKFTYVDRATEFDYIEWELDNSDGKLTHPDYLSLGIIVSAKIGYIDATFPWKSFVINRLRGGVGVYGRQDSPLDTKQATITYFGRNRNAPGGHPSGKVTRAWSNVAKAPHKKPGKTYGASSSITQYEMGLTSNGPKVIKASTTAEAILRIAERNGYRAGVCLIQPTNDSITHVTIQDGLSDGQFLNQTARKLHYIFKIDSDGIFHFHKPHWAGAQHPVAESMIYAGGPDILEVSIDCDFRLPMPSEAKAKGYDWRMRIGHAGIIARGEALGDVQLSSTFRRMLEAPIQQDHLTRVESGLVVGGLKTAQNKARQLILQRNWNAFQLNVKVVGNPNCLARRLFNLSGTGSAFVDGQWYISEAKHDITQTEYTTELHLKHPPKTGAAGSKVTVGHHGDLSYNQQTAKTGGNGLGTVFNVRPQPSVRSSRK